MKLTLLVIVSFAVAISGFSTTERGAKSVLKSKHAQIDSAAFKESGVENAENHDYGLLIC